MKKNGRKRRENKEARSRPSIYVVSVSLSGRCGVSLYKEWTTTEVEKKVGPI